MVLRFARMDMKASRARAFISRACRDLSNSSLTMFNELKRQFYILPNFDVFIDDDMDHEYSGYILKCLRTIGLLEENAEVIVPDKHDISRDEPAEALADMADIADTEEESGKEDECEIIDFADIYMPPEVFDESYWTGADLDDE